MSTASESNVCGTGLDLIACIMKSVLRPNTLKSSSVSVLIFKDGSPNKNFIKYAKMEEMIEFIFACLCEKTFHTKNIQFFSPTPMSNDFVQYGANKKACRFGNATKFSPHNKQH
jgi:hypothetical protein